MSKEGDLGFDYDERTTVPTYEEISGVLKVNSKNKEKAKKSDKKGIKKINKNRGNNPKKDGSPDSMNTRPRNFLRISLILIILLLICISVFFIYKYPSKTLYVIKNSGNEISQFITGYLIKNNPFSNNQIAPDYEISGIKINLTEEEMALMDNLRTICEDEKTELAKDVRDQKTIECNRQKDSLESQINSQEEEISSLNRRLNSCYSSLEIS
jgi:hypothetical protein